MAWGALIGLICMTPLAGAMAGAAAGALGAPAGRSRHRRKLCEASAALFLLIRKMTSDKVLAGLRGAGGTALCSSFDETQEEALQGALAGAQALSVKTAG